MAKIMIIEDDENIGKELAILLKNAGYEVYNTTEFQDLLSQVFLLQPDLILLDVLLPNQNGFNLCAQIRQTLQTPILFVTSKNTPMDELHALSLGGDDFISKPYNIPVLLARVNALLRRSKTAEETLEYNGLQLSLVKSLMVYDQKSVELTKNECKILYCLFQQAGSIVSRGDLIDFLWDNQIYIDDNALSVNVTRLREKLTLIGKPDFILTKRKMGYRI